jgi:LmbE family N-acetylglucosaminyl deacetylase
VELTHALADLIAELEPRWVLVQPYEGGHPDHDACAFAACAALTGRAAADPALLEMTAYHRAGEGLETGCFLNRVTTESVRALSPEQQDLKSRMLACFETQAEILREFRVAEERFRVAPRYDFTKPPHPGPLHYESLGWPMSAGRWCELASEAWEKLQLEQRAK